MAKQRIRQVLQWSWSSFMYCNLSDEGGSEVGGLREALEAQYPVLAQRKSRRFSSIEVAVPLLAF
jgi:hypothetical protein